MFNNVLGESNNQSRQWNQDKKLKTIWAKPKYCTSSFCVQMIESGSVKSIREINFKEDRLTNVPYSTFGNPVHVNHFYPWSCLHRRFHFDHHQWFITHASQTMVPILLFHYLPSCLHLIHCQKKQGRVESLDGLDWNTLFRYFSLHMQYCFRYASLDIQFYLEGKKQESGIKIPK